MQKIIIIIKIDSNQTCSIMCVLGVESLRVVKSLTAPSFPGSVTWYPREEDAGPLIAPETWMAPVYVVVLTHIMGSYGWAANTRNSIMQVKNTSGPIPQWTNSTSKVLSSIPLHQHLIFFQTPERLSHICEDPFMWTPWPHYVRWPHRPIPRDLRWLIGLINRATTVACQVRGRATHTVPHLRGRCV